MVRPAPLSFFLSMRCDMQECDIGWEVKQLWAAIEYHEKRRTTTFSAKEAEELEQIVKDLNGRLKELERSIDERL